MYVNATEFRTNVGKYLVLALSEDVFILKHGRPMVRISSSDDTIGQIIDSLWGALEGVGDPEKLLEERLSDYESLN